MKKPILYALSFFLLISQILISGCMDETIPQGDIIVDDDGSGMYQHIQEAINAAALNDTIFVKNGVYQGEIVINKTIHLIGENSKKTIIDDKEKGNGIIIKANDVTITNLTVRNSGLKSTYYEMDGAITVQAHNVRISHCICKDSVVGIQIKNTMNNVLDHNVLDNNSHGIFLYFSNSNEISNNTLIDNYDYGCYLYSDSNNNIITDNDFLDNRYSLRIKSRENTVRSNLFKDNRFGIYFCCGSKNNMVYHNTVINNTMFQGADNFNNNTWYHPDLGGNYWDDYLGVDENNDGFGDTPYIVDQQDNTQQIAEDLFPLINPKVTI